MLPRMTTERIYLGLDIGGTKVLAVVARSDGETLAEQRCPTDSGASPDRVLHDAADAARDALRSTGLSLADAAAVGLAIAGPTDFAAGVVTSSPNLPRWRSVPAAAIVSDLLGLPAYLDNDANAAALGEHRFGAARGARHAVYLTVSTGIGGGIVIEGRIYRGASGSAGEFGHMSIRADDPPTCSCGGRGCLETLASGTAMEREARAAVERGEAPGLAALFGDGEPTAELVEAAARGGDARALAIIEDAARYFGMGMANIVNALNPEVIVIGGGVSNMGDLYLGPAVRTMREQAFALPVGAVDVRPAELGGRSAALGAVALAAEASGGD